MQPGISLSNTPPNLPCNSLRETCLFWMVNPSSWPWLYGELGVGHDATWSGWWRMEVGAMGGGKEKVGLGRVGLS